MSISLEAVCTKLCADGTSCQTLSVAPRSQVTFLQEILRPIISVFPINQERKFSASADIFLKHEVLILFCYVVGSSAMQMYCSPHQGTLFLTSLDLLF